jgi:membrane protease YdiL (CAAX protease family)
MSSVTQPASAPQASASSERPAALKQWVTRHPVLAYLILTFAVSWTLFTVPVFSRSGIGLLPFDVPYTIFVLLASILGISGSAFAITAVVDGRPGVRALASRYLRWRVGPQWYLIAFFGLPLVALLGVSTGYGLTPFLALPHHGPELLGFIVQVVTVAILVNVWEETGWTGFMFTRLQPRYGALVSSLLIAPCFGAIHLPLLFVSGAVTTTKLTPSLVVLGIAELLVLASVPWRILAAWFYNNTRGSLLTMGLLHASLDATTGAALLASLVPGGGTFAQVWGAFAVVGLLLIIVTRGRLSYKPSPDLQPAPTAEPR